MDVTEEPVNRSEYEQFVKTYEIRHTELRLEIKEVETDLKTQMNTMINKMDGLTNQVNKKSMDAWKLIATSAVSVIVGYVAQYLQHAFLR